MRPARATLFDLDGTLVDSEPATDRAIASVMARHGIGAAKLPPYETHGRTWRDVVRALLARYPAAIAPADLQSELESFWIVECDQAMPIPGSVEAVRAAAARFGIAVVSSSARRVIDTFIARLGIGGLVPPAARIGAESVARSKPDPEGYLLAAARLGVGPDECVVFEDSRAGLLAARAAGMRSVLVLHGAAEPDECRDLATASCRDYLALPPDFFPALAAGLELSGRAWP